MQRLVSLTHVQSWEGCCGKSIPAAQVIAVKAPGFGERKTSYLEDIAILTGAQVVKDELGLTLDKVSQYSSLMPLARSEM